MKDFSHEDIYETLTSFENPSSKKAREPRQQSEVKAKKRPFLDRAKAVLNKLAEIAEPIKKIASAIVSVSVAIGAIFSLSRGKSKHTCAAGGAV